MSSRSGASRPVRGSSSRSNAGSSGDGSGKDDRADVRRRKARRDVSQAVRRSPRIPQPNRRLLLDLDPARFVRLDAESDVVADAKMGIRGRVLKDDGDVAFSG